RRRVAAAPQALADLEAVYLGQAHVEDDQVVTRHGQPLQGLPAVARQLGDVALPLEVEDQPLRDRLLVLHHEDPRRRSAHRAASGGAIGRSMTKRLPGRPSWENASTVPCISRTSPETIESPRPVPCL